MTTAIKVGDKSVACSLEDETRLRELRDETRWNREYALWKKTTAYLYDNVLVHALEWPSLTVQWLPGARPSAGGAAEDWTTHSLLLATHSSGSDVDRLFVVEARLPDDDSLEEAGRFEREGADVSHGWGGTAACVTVVAAATMDAEVHRVRYMPQRPNIVAVKSPASEVYVLDMAAKRRRVEPPKKKKEEEEEEEEEGEEGDDGGSDGGGSSSEGAGAAEGGGGSAAAKAAAAARAQYEPTFTPEHVCCGHSDEGWAVAWSPHEAMAGRLLSGSDDHLVCQWDLGSGGGQRRKKLDAVATYRGHEGGVNDVCWSPVAPHLFASASDDGSVALWDSRCSGRAGSGGGGGGGGDGAVARVAGAHGGAAVQCVALSPFCETLMASGGADGTVRLWDSRCMVGEGGGGGGGGAGAGGKGAAHSSSSAAAAAAASGARPSHVCASHADEVLSVVWHPERETVLASGGCDRRIMLWDLARVGREQGEEEALDGPPELLFVHGGHTNKVTDMSWCPEPGSTSYMASVAEDNILQIWQPTDAVMNGLNEGYGFS